MSLALWSNIGYGAAGATATIDLGGNSVTAGDLLIVVTAVNNQAGDGDPGQPAAPSGWTGSGETPVSDRLRG